MGKAEKEYMVAEISNKFKENSNLYISNFTNVTAEQLNDLRNKLTKESSRYFVVKNRLCRLALKKAKLDKLADLMSGQAGFVLCGDNAITISKILVNFSKGAEGFTVRGGYIDGQLLSDNQVRELALLPSRDEMMAMFAYAIKAPIAGFANIFRQLIKGLVVSLSEISKQKAEDK